MSIFEQLPADKSKMIKDAEQLQQDEKVRAVGDSEKIPAWQKRDNEKVIKSNHPEYFKKDEE